MSQYIYQSSSNHQFLCNKYQVHRVRSQQLVFPPSNFQYAFLSASGFSFVPPFIQKQKPIKFDTSLIDRSQVLQTGLLFRLHNQQMNHYIKARTNAINCQGGIKQLRILEEMFPLYTIQQSDISQALQKYFDITNSLHLRFLQQACFKSPLQSASRVYVEFKNRRHPQIKSPLISNYFPNTSFISLEELQEWLDGEAEYPSPAFSEEINNQIPEALLNISQEFGYVPNLQRFLLYFPNYFLKVQKFKNRFFEQRIKETSEVTYLSPKNCCFAGLIAAIQIGCPYMILRMANMFLVRDGNPEWITHRKYPSQFNLLFNLFRKLAVLPWSLNENDLNFSKTNWGKEVYFDLITSGMFVLSMSTIALALGLVPDEPCQILTLEQIMQMKKSYDEDKYESIQPKAEYSSLIKEIRNGERQPTKEVVHQIQEKQVEIYMKQIGTKISSFQLYHQFNKKFEFFGSPTFQQVNIKAKDNSFFHRCREIIEKGLEDQRNSDTLQDNKFSCFKQYCIEGSNMSHNLLDKDQHNSKIFRKLIEILTYNLCGYHRELFDYKKYIKLNEDLTMPLKFFIRLLSLSPLYIKKQVLDEINHKKWNTWRQCFDLGHIAINVAQSKAKFLMSSIQFYLFK